VQRDASRIRVLAVYLRVLYVCSTLAHGYVAVYQWLMVVWTKS